MEQYDFAAAKRFCVTLIKLGKGTHIVSAMDNIFKGIEENSSESAGAAALMLVDALREKKLERFGDIMLGMLFGLAVCRASTSTDFLTTSAGLDKMVDDLRAGRHVCDADCGNEAKPADTPKESVAIVKNLFKDLLAEEASHGA